MEQTVLSDEVLFALFKLIPPLETGKYISVSKKWSTIITDNELWRSYCEQRWRVLPSEKDIAKNWIIPTIKHDNKAIRIDWHKYYLLRNANERQMVAVKKFAEAAKSQARNKKIQIVDPFAKTGIIDFKEVKKSLKVLHSVVNHWMDHVELDDDEVNFGGRRTLEPPGSIMDILNFSVDLELHMASKTNITRVNSLQFTSDFLLNVQACLELVEMPQLELQMTTRLVQACKEYYRIGLQQSLPVDTVSEFYLATIEMISACRSFKQRKTQLNLLLQVLGIIADSLTHWQTDDTWHDWCNSRLLDDDDAQSPMGGFLNSLKSGASTAGSKPWYSFLSNYAAQHYPPKDAREQLTLFMICACEVNHITPYLNKYRDEIIPKYFEPILNSEDDEMMVPFLFMYESVATYVENGFIETLADLALPRITALLTQGSDGVVLLAESALIATLNNRIVDQFPNLAKHLTPSLVEALLSLMKSNVKTIVKQAADAITCVFSFMPQLYNQELETKIGAAFQSVNPEFTQSVLPNLVELSSVVEVVSLPGVTEAFNQTLAAYSNTENADPNPILRMTQFISFSPKPSQVLVDALPAIMPIIINVINQNIAAGLENMFGVDVHDNGEEEVELEVPDEFLTLTDRRFENKSAAFASLTNMLNNMPASVITPHLDTIGNTLVSAISAVASQEILKDLRSSLTALAGFIHRNDPTKLQALIEVIWQTARNSENLMTYPDVILNHLIDLQKFLSTNAPQIFPAILPATLDIIRPLIDVTTTIDENDSVASGNLGYGELTLLFENVVTFAPDKKFILESVKPFFQAFELELKLPNPESWTIYDMISVVYEQCGSELTPEDTFGFMKYLWAARVLDTRYVSQTVAYTLSFLARDHPELLPDTLEECINWTLRWLNIPNIREENAAVYDNVLVAFGRLINLYKEDQEWLEQFTTFVKYLPPTEDGDATEGLDVLALFSEYVKRAEKIGMDAQLRTDVERVQKEAEKYVPIFK